MKNCDPLVLGPLFAMETTPRTLCWTRGKTSAWIHICETRTNLGKVLYDLELFLNTIIKNKSWLLIYSIRISNELLKMALTVRNYFFASSAWKMLSEILFTSVFCDENPQTLLLKHRNDCSYFNNKLLFSNQEKIILEKIQMKTLSAYWEHRNTFRYSLNSSSNFLPQMLLPPFPVPDKEAPQ